MTTPTAKSHYEHGLALEEAGDLDGAVAAFEAAHRLAPDVASPAFALGVAHKWRRDFEASLRWSEVAVALEPDHEGAGWNAGIAATALGLHRRARQAWAPFVPGIEISDMPFQLDLGPTPIRITPGGTGEVAWTTRIDPARAVIRSIPLPESGFAHGDVVLHDGEPRGSRMRGTKSVPVFDVLTILERSRDSTFVVTAPDVSASALDALAEDVHAAGAALEDWTTSLTVMCRACSYGEPHDDHDALLEDEPRERRLAIAATSEDVVRDVVSAWAKRAGLDDVVVTCEVDRRGAEQLPA